MKEVSNMTDQSQHTGTPQGRELLTVSCRRYGNRITVFADRVVIKRKDKTILISSVSSIGYFPGIPLLLCPVMTIVHRDEAGKDTKTRVAFHGVFPRLFTGFMKPGECVRLLRKLVADRHS